MPASLRGGAHQRIMATGYRQASGQGRLGYGRETFAQARGNKNRRAVAQAPWSGITGQADAAPG